MAWIIIIFIALLIFFSPAAYFLGTILGLFFLYGFGIVLWHIFSSEWENRTQPKINFTKITSVIFNTLFIGGSIVGLLLYALNK